ncbi:MAG: accessory Sec system translocase SecA2 [Acidobacteriota bacterium]
MIETNTAGPSGRPTRPGRRPHAFSARLAAAFNRFRGCPVETDLAGYERTVLRMRGLADRLGLAGIPDAEIARRAAALRPLLSEPLAARGRPAREAFDGAGVEAFALAVEAARRAVGLAAHDVQVVAALAMADGNVAQLPTGEGKTLAAVFAAAFFALSGRPVHVLTFNDYLARRDAAWMGPAYRLLGLSVGAVQEGQDKPAKRTAYACDVAYATAKEAGFDYLRDRLALEPDELVHRPFAAAILDEADSILIDEARIPLVISGTAAAAAADASRLASIVRGLERGRDFETDAANASVFPTDAGLRRVESLLGRGDLFAAGNETLLAAVHCALHAQVLLERDVDYVVRGGRVEIVDEFTGRVMDKRHWPDGLQAAVEAKEGVDRGAGSRILGSITLQHFFRLYPTLCGMTATAAPSARELREFYGMGVVVVPPHRPCVRRDLADVVFSHKAAKVAALVREIAGARASGRPVLVGTASVRESEELAAALAAAGLACNVLNAKNDEAEAEIVARAGAPGALTISTNMAGRGTDIRLGGPDERERDRVAALGGLYVIGTNRHESRRIDDQLRGRAGRQGDPGSSRFFISLEDDVFERYGLAGRLFARHGLERQNAPVESGLLRRDILHGQRVIEGRNLDIRRALWDYSTLAETQRRIVAGWRDAAFGPAGEDPEGAPFPTSPELREAGAARLGAEAFDRAARRAALVQIDAVWADHLAWLADLREGIHLVSIGRLEPLLEYQKAATDAFLGLEGRIRDAIETTLRPIIARGGPVDLEAAGLKGPSSTWTYLVDDDQLGWGVQLLRGGNVGFASVAAAFYGPLFVLALIASRFGRKRRRTSGGNADGGPGA